MIDTRDFMRTPDGERCGVLRYCICPSGLHHKRNDTDLELLSSNMKDGIPALRNGVWSGNMPIVS